jgi:hypothetical protein
MSEERRIEDLIIKYRIKQPGESNRVSSVVSSNVQSFRLNEKIIYSRWVMRRLNIYGESCDQVIFLIHEFRDFKVLCAKCKCELVITALCFYVKFSNSKKYPLSDYSIAGEVGLTDEIFSKILLKLVKYFQGDRRIRHVRNV